MSIPGPSEAPLLEIEDLRTQIARRHGAVRAVDGVSLVVEAGETVGLVGESGCGKTMTAMSITRLLPPGGRIVGGAVRLAGRDLVGLSEADMRQVRGERVSVVFQDPMTSLNPTATIGHQIAESVRVHRHASRAGARRRAADMLGLVGFPRPSERLDDYPHQLSGGLRQRAMIGLALACEPDLLIADEPTTALDVTIQAQILELLDRLKAQLGMGLLLVTHDMGVIAGRADRVLVMYAGRIVESAATDELFADPAHPYTEALLESIPQLGQSRSQRLYSIPGLPPDLTNPPPACRFAARCRYASAQCRDDEPQLVERPRASEGRGASGRGASERGASGRGASGRGVEFGVENTRNSTRKHTFVDPAHRYACFFPRSAANGPAPPPAAAPTPVAAREAAPTQAPTTLLRVRDVTKEYAARAGLLQGGAGSVKAVSGVSFDVARGETFGLVGESGCGKTTLGRLIVASEQPDSGSVQVDGVGLETLSGRALRRARRDVQLVFQDAYSSLDPRMRIGSILREPLRVQRVGDRPTQNARVAELLDSVGLPGTTVDRYPHELSGGQRQRVGFARALALHPKLVVADEPVSALDVSIQAQLINLMMSLQDELGLTYVMISHDLAVVRYVANRIGVMYLGKLVEVGPAETIYRAPAHPYTAGLLEAIPVPDPAAERAKEAAALRGELPSAVNPPSGCRFRTRCALAEERCAIEEPPLRAFGDGQLAACHFPLVPPAPLQAAPLVPSASPTPATPVARDADGSA